MTRGDSPEKTLMLGKIEGRRRRGRQRIRWLDGTTDSTGTNLSKLWQMVTNREAWHAAVHGPTTVRHHLGAEQLPLDCFKLSDGEGLCFGHEGIPRT